jgi:hypothetical protein
MEDSVECPFVESCLERIESLTRSASFAQVVTGAERLPSGTTIELGPFTLCNLTPVQIEMLESFCHCRCPDWSRVLIMYDERAFLQERIINLSLKEQVSHCRFEGVVVIGLTRNPNPNEEEECRHRLRLPPGVHYNTLIKDSIFEPGSCVYNNTTIESTYVMRYGSIIHCGSLTRTQTGTSTEPLSAACYLNFASSVSINVGPETGGSRTISAFPEMTLMDAARDLKLSSSSVASSKLPPYGRAQTLATRCPLNIVSSYCTIRDASSVKDVCLLPHSYILGSSSVQNVTLLSHAKIEGGKVENSQLQWDAEATYAHVTNSLLMEHSHADKNSIVVSSILGPDSHSSGGEVQYSILGEYILPTYFFKCSLDVHRTKL